jgi:hypothetical protein
MVVQATLYDGRGRCVVILPHANDGDPNLTPAFQIEGREVFLDALRIMNGDATVLGRHMEPLADHTSSDAIVNAIDAVITPYG